MTVKVTILGSGTCVPRLDRSACALLLETRQAKIALDMGPGTIRRLLEAGVSIFDLTHIALSHFHPDHSADLVPLLFATKYPDGQRRQRQLQVMGGRGLNAFYQGLQQAYGQWIVLPESQMHVWELDTEMGEILAFDDFRIIARPVDHRPESVAYRIESEEGPTLVYSGDTNPCDSLVELARNADILVCESAMPDGQEVPGHLTPSLAGQIASRAKVKQLVLTHFYPPCDDVDVVKQAAGAYKGRLVAAEDLMTFILA